jgi:N-methylhydantoinase A
MLMADTSADAAQSVLSPLAVLAADQSLLVDAVEALAVKTRRTLGLEDTESEETSASLDLRYRGQSYELTVPLGLPVTGTSVQAAAEAFHAAHAQRYGYAMPREPLEAVTLRVRTTIPGPQLRPQPRPLAGSDPSPARLGERSVWFDAEGPQPTACYRRDLLQPGNRIDGPCLVLQYDSTLLLAPTWSAQVDVFGNLLCEKRETHG